LAGILDEVVFRDEEARDRRIKAEEAGIERERMRQIAIERAKVL
jgi:hypothetical protein